MQPSAYHLGECNFRVTNSEGKLERCGKPAVERIMSLAPMEIDGDRRRCEEHLKD
jgi:hypothetical protein